MFGRRLRRNDKAVTEVIGYVLSFALSAIFLLIALNVFYAARGNTDAVVTGVELKSLADRVAAAIVEMGLVSQEFPNAKMDVMLVIPQSLDGTLYSISADEETVTARTNDGELEATSSTYRTDELDLIQVDGEVDSSNGRLNIRYEIVGGYRRIQLNGE